MKRKIKETDLYLPVKNYFEALGYTVKGEVKDCDIAAVKEAELVVIELKTGFNTKLLFQAIDRQKTADKVYMAIPALKWGERNFSKMLYIAKSLNIGLITVKTSIKKAEVHFEPIAGGRIKNNRKKRVVTKELKERISDLNTGGTNNQKLITAYREKCVYAGVIMMAEGPVTAKKLRKEFNFDVKYAHPILYLNYYGWFEKTDKKGVYTLTEKGWQEISRDFEDLFKIYQRIYQEEKGRRYMMQLFNASSMFNAIALEEILNIADNPVKLRERLIEGKKNILKLYNFKAYNLPEDFPTTSYIIAANHLTDSDAPLIMSYYYELMHQYMDSYPELFVFAKENCFNGVSIPKELIPILESEKVFPVDRNSLSGSFEAIRAAKKWFAAGEKPKHFLIFAQGTIYDINKEQVADIEKGAFWLGQALGIDVLPAFIEQAVEGAENRLIFGKPISISKDCRNLDKHKQLWLERIIEAQHTLETLTGSPAREVMLDERHKTRKKIQGNK